MGVTQRRSSFGRRGRADTVAVPPLATIRESDKHSGGGDDTDTVVWRQQRKRKRKRGRNRAGRVRRDGTTGASPQTDGGGREPSAWANEYDDDDGDDGDMFQDALDRFVASTDQSDAGSTTGVRGAWDGVRAEGVWSGVRADVDSTGDMNDSSSVESFQSAVSHLSSSSVVHSQCSLDEEGVHAEQAGEGMTEDKGALVPERRRSQSSSDQRTLTRQQPFSGGDASAHDRVSKKAVGTDRPESRDAVGPQRDQEEVQGRAKESKAGWEADAVAAAGDHGGEARDDDDDDAHEGSDSDMFESDETDSSLANSTELLGQQLSHMDLLVCVRMRVCVRILARVCVYACVRVYTWVCVSGFVCKRRVLRDGCGAEHGYYKVEVHRGLCSCDSLASLTYTTTSITTLAGFFAAFHPCSTLSLPICLPYTNIWSNSRACVYVCVFACVCVWFVPRHQDMQSEHPSFSRIAPRRPTLSAAITVPCAVTMLV